MPSLGKSTFYGNAAAAMRQVMRGGKPGPITRSDPSEMVAPQSIPVTYAVAPVSRSNSQVASVQRVGGLQALLRALSRDQQYTTDVGQPVPGAANQTGTTAIPQSNVMSEPPAQIQEGVTRVSQSLQAQGNIALPTSEVVVNVSPIARAGGYLRSVIKGS